jgi:serine/threonine-protein kinase HipA
MKEKTVHVYVSLGGKDILAGELWFHFRKGRESASFEYDRGWLTHAERFALEPALQLTEGAFHTRDDKPIFGAIGDSSPDRWGRTLMRRSEKKRADSANETPNTLMEADFLLGVNDETRQGALRFSKELDGPFLSPAQKNAIPPLIALPELLTASQKFLDAGESADDLRLLLAPGSSLGGARPKASIRDKDGSLAIAKFPRRDDLADVVSWEGVALALAEKANISVPKWRLEKVLGKSVLVANRFDRKNTERIPFLSALAMLDARDGELRSYLEIAEALARCGSRPDEDMAELWRRIVFNILISNTDDHPRNHGFLYESRKGWRLSPAYDLNPMPAAVKPRFLSMSIDTTDNKASLSTALSVASHFRLPKEKACHIVQEITAAVVRWRHVAKSLGIKELDMEEMASAFEHEDLEQAKKI